MADNATLPATGVGTADIVVATDKIGGVDYQRVKVVWGADGTATDASAAAPLPVSTTTVYTRISQTPTVSTSPAYTAKDAVGGLLTFANAAASSGGTGTIVTAQVIDNSQQRPSLELVLFDRTFSASTDNAIFAPSDADLANAIGVIGLNAWSDFSTNSTATAPNVGLAFKLNGTSMFGQLVTRGTPTFVATTDIIVILTIATNG